MTDRDRWGLRGPVQVCRLQRTWYSRCGSGVLCETDERGDSSIVEFRMDGSLVSRRHQNPDGSAWTSMHEYDDAGRLVTVRTENAAQLVHAQRYEYDADGRLLRIVALAGESSERTTETYKYDAAGRKTKTIYVDPTTESACTMCFWSVEGSDCGYSAPGAAKLTTLHNECDQPIELVFHGKGGGTLSRVEFVYDDMGQLVEETQTMTISAEMFPAEALAGITSAELQALRNVLGDATRRVHRYDAQGHRIETQASMFAALSRDSKTMVYNDFGDQIEEISEFEHRDYNIDDEGRLADSPIKKSRSEARFRYDYDVRGNWIKKVVEGRNGADEDFSVSSTEQRVLKYYR